MLMLLLYAAVFIFVVVFILRALLMAGYENMNQKHERRKTSSIFKGLLNQILLMKPIGQPKLRPRSIDHKVHMRFQRKSTIYYYALWICMFIILYLVAKIYMGAF
jgi:hypothetical protein